MSIDGRIVRLYYVSGTVQGVGYRYFAQNAALRLRVSGYVKNLRDGRVEIYAVGSVDQLLALKEELGRGPRGASVRQVAEEEAEFDEKYDEGFAVERSSR